MVAADRLAWRTSSLTDNGNACVEVAPTAGGVLVRDTKDHGSGPVLSFTHEQWAAFLARPTATVADFVTTHDGVDVPTRWHLRDTLHFTDVEWDAFLVGAAHGEFTFRGEAHLVTL
ncbi:MAG: DUF397 domain-containing protein [Pseudonocardiales bacterium]|nr:DUF397 domain-containing protein [Pseudonocardiales bacterium]